MGPASELSEEDARALVKRAQELHTQILAREDFNFRAAADDLRMLGKDPWDPAARAEREAIGRPLVSLNPIHTYIGQITGEIRRNKPSIHCSPGDGAATPEIAELMEGIIRSFERSSDAASVYAAVAESVCEGAQGHMRLHQVYTNEDNFEQELRVSLIEDPFGVLWGECKRADKSDAKECLVPTEMSKKEFDEKYPEKSSATWAQSKPFAGGEQCKWRCDEMVTLAEYWVVKEAPVTLYRFIHNRSFVDEYGQFRPATRRETIIKHDPENNSYVEDDLLARVQAMGFTLVQKRQAARKKICMYLLGGNAVLEGPIEWPGTRIPIFTCEGRLVRTGEETVRMSLVRNVKDTLKILNLARSIDLELLGISPKAPYLADQKAIAGHEDIWDRAHKVPFPYLPYNSRDDEDREVARPERAQPIGANTGPQALGATAINDMEQGLGIFSSQIGRESPEKSAVAIQAREAQSDTGTYFIIDNLNSMLAAMGQEAVNVIPIIYSQQEMLAIVGPDDAPAIVNLMELKAQGRGLDVGKYLVNCKTGPAYQTKREKALDRYVQMLPFAGDYAPIIFKQIARYDDLPDSDEFIAEIQAFGAARGLLGPPPGAMPPAGPPRIPPDAPIPPDLPPRGASPVPPNAPPFRPITHPAFPARGAAVAPEARPGMGVY